MEELKYYCDRCKIEVGKPKEFIILGMWKPSEEHQLCYKCKKAFNKWLKEVKKNGK